MKKGSLRGRITIVYVAIIALLLTAIILINRYFLASFYQRQKISELESAYDSINELVLKASETGLSFSDLLRNEKESSEKESQADSLLRKLTNKSNIDILIKDNETGELIGSSRESAWLAMKLQTYLEFRGTISDELMPESLYKKIKETENYVVQSNYDRRSGTVFLECWGNFKDGRTSFIMSMPMESVVESSTITNRFILIVGIAALFIGIAVILIVTGAIVKPINRLAGIAKKMSVLDFSEKYEGKSDDEIEVLGNAMNQMSSELEKTINDLRDANIKLQEDIDLKERVDEMRKDFISNVSHELKTPIAIIEGYAEGLTEGIAEEPESRDYYCNVIMDESKKMSKMVRQLTSLINYEFGEANLSIEQFDLSELIRNCLDKEKLKIEEKGAHVTCDIPESLNVIADEFKIEEVFTNYFTNALNHVSGDMNIRICLKKKDVKTAELSVYNDGENIPPESLDRIWEKFYKVDKARTREYGGSGIGLSIVKAIMEAHGGGYGVKNLENGVEFYITLDSIG